MRDLHQQSSEQPGQSGKTVQNHHRRVQTRGFQGRRSGGHQDQLRSLNDGPCLLRHNRRVGVRTIQHLANLARPRVRSRRNDDPESTEVLPEKPARLEQMTLRALTEGIITKERAGQICPGCMGGMPTETDEGDKPMSASALRKLPREQRDAILAAAAREAEQEYLRNRELTGFEAFSEEDLNDQDEGAQ